MKLPVFLSLVLAVSVVNCSCSFASKASQCKPAVTRPLVEGAPSLERLQGSSAQLDMSETVEHNTSEDVVDNEIPEEVRVSESGGGGGGGPSNRKKWVAVAGVTALSTLCVAAKTGFLPGIPLGDGTFSSYTDAMIVQDTGSTLLALGLAYGFVKAITALALNGILDPKDSRKIIHTLTGPLFIATWPVFSEAYGARYFAAVVGAVNSIRLILAASGSEEEAELAGAVSRSGNAKEALGGPFLYVLTISATTLLFWRTSLIGIFAASTMAAGDGLADIVGRRLGKNNKWPFSESKSVAGSAAFVVAASLVSTALAAWMSYTNCLTLPMPLPELFPRIVAISALSAGVELIPFADDNWTVPLSAAIFSSILLY